ncbi:MAG: 3-methyl-2-oxobutanoate hydroxymethyltransferase [Verrucomicrobia bacterium Tous-C9LFEB]|nr:MAG: 3-methyl-2-oxobutanoate hydroxymethyltransferase [Verrucomicrobia bacterium Tous-C9LFEB]
MNAPTKVTPQWIRDAKKRGERLPTLTAYDYPTAKLLDESGIPLLLVGDSLGMVMLGYPDTTEVTMEDILHHTRAVARAKTNALVVSDLPIHSYDTPELAVANARRLVAAGAEAVKLEGGAQRIAQVDAIIAAGIPMFGHLGMLPQAVREEGGYKIKGRVAEERERLLSDAKALEKAGAFAIVLELVLPEVAVEISRSISIPTIGIGSGPNCDGEIMVVHDLLGTFPWFRPKFVKEKNELGEAIRTAARAYASRVKQS